MNQLNRTSSSSTTTTTASSSSAGSSVLLQRRKSDHSADDNSICMDLFCTNARCAGFREMLAHHLECPGKVKSGCAVCVKVWSIMLAHAKQCENDKCGVPYCASMKKNQMWKRRSTLPAVQEESAVGDQAEKKFMQSASKEAVEACQTLDQNHTMIVKNHGMSSLFMSTSPPTPPSPAAVKPQPNVGSASNGSPVKPQSIFGSSGSGSPAKSLAVGGGSNSPLAKPKPLFLGSSSARSSPSGNSTPTKKANDDDDDDDDTPQSLNSLLRGRRGKPTSPSSASTSSSSKQRLFVQSSPIVAGMRRLSFRKQNSGGAGT